jgi:hypothetical protein
MIALIGAIVFAAVGLVGAYISYNNKYTTMKNLIAAKQTDIENNYDAMWKIISQQAQVTEQYKDSFKEIYIGIMDARYGSGDGTLMKWIKEANPEFDASLFKTLMISIEANRKEFMNKQTQLIDMHREITNLQTVIPSKWFVPNTPIEIKIITSSKAKRALESGMDDEVDLFGKKAEEKSSAVTVPTQHVPAATM